MCWQGPSGRLGSVMMCQARRALQLGPQNCAGAAGDGCTPSCLIVTTSPLLLMGVQIPALKPLLWPATKSFVHPFAIGSDLLEA